MQCRLGLCLEVLAIDQSKAAWGAPKHDVLGHGHGGHKVELLVDGGDSQRLRGLGIWDLHLCAIYQDAAGIWFVHSGNHLDEGGLAGAIFTQQGLHLAAADGEVYPLNDLHRAEGFGDIVQAQHAVTHGVAPSSWWAVDMRGM